MALQYGVPLESLVQKFAHQRFEPSGFTKNPEIRNAASHHRLRLPLARLPVHQGYKEATSPGHSQRRAAAEGDSPTWRKRPINRPVSDLSRTGDKESSTSSRTTPQRRQALGPDATDETHAERVRTRSATCSWTSPARTAAATRSSAPAPAASAPSAARARGAVKNSLGDFPLFRAGGVDNPAPVATVCDPPAVAGLTLYGAQRNRDSTTEGNSTGRRAALQRAAGTWLCQGTLPWQLRGRLGHALSAPDNRRNRRRSIVP